MTEAEEEVSLKVSHMTYAELVGFFHLQVGRVEMNWHRIMYLHAAIVGVLVFFGEAEHSYLKQRVLVFGFYTANLLIFYVGLREGYQALTDAQRDLQRFPKGDGAVEAWFRQRRFGHRSAIRIVVLSVTWALIGSLLFQSWLFG